MPRISKQSLFTSMTCSLSFQTRALRKNRNSARVRLRNSWAASSPPGVYSCVARTVLIKKRGDAELSPCLPFSLSPCLILPDASQLLQQMPVLQAILLGVQQERRRVAVLVEVLGEAALAAGEV